MISKRQLMKWRREALIHKQVQDGPGSGGVLGTATESSSYINKVLRLTQELIDLYILLEGGKAK